MTFSLSYRSCEYIFEPVSFDKEILDEPFDSLEYELEVGNDKIFRVVHEIFEFFLNYAHKRFVVAYPKLCLCQELPVLSFFDQPMGEFPSAFPSKAPNQSQEAT